RLIASQQPGELSKAAEESISYGRDESRPDSSNISQPENIDDLFPGGYYRDIPGLCKVATIEEIEERGWSLNPGRYVGIAEREEDDVDFQVRLEELYEELELLNAEAGSLENK